MKFTSRGQQMIWDSLNIQAVAAAALILHTEVGKSEWNEALAVMATAPAADRAKLKRAFEKRRG